MSPKAQDAAKKEFNHEEEGARLIKRGFEIRLRGQKKWLSDVLKKRPDLIPSIVNHVQGLGIDAPTPPSLTPATLMAMPVTTGPDQACPPTPAGAAAMSESGAGRTSSTASVTDEGGDDDDDDIGQKIRGSIPRKYGRINELPQDYIIDMLQVAEPAVLNERNLRALAVGRGKLVRKEPAETRRPTSHRTCAPCLP